MLPRLASMLVLVSSLAPPSTPAADLPTWYLTNALVEEGGSLGPNLVMGEGVGNGTFPSGFIAVDPTKERIWTADVVAPTEVSFGMSRWWLTIGGTSVVSNLNWQLGTWDPVARAFEAAPGPGQTVTNLSAQTSQAFQPEALVVIEPDRRLALRMTSSNGASLLDVWNEVPGSNSPSFLSVDGFPVLNPVADAQADLNRTQCHHRTVPATCNELWEQRYSGPLESHGAAGIVTSPDGSRVFVTGTSSDRRTNADLVTLAYDRDGALLWTARVDGPAHSSDRATHVALTPDGKTVFVVGYLCVSAGALNCSLDLDLVLVAYDASNGAERWRQTYRASGQKEVVPYALAVSPDGATVAVTASTTAGTVAGFDVLTLAYEAATGVRRWAATYNGPANDEDRPSALTFAPDGSRVYSVGWSRGIGTDLDYIALAYDAASGASLLTLRRDLVGGSDRARGIAVTATRLILTGTATTSNGADIVTVAYDLATSQPAWAHVHNGPWSGSDTATSVMLAPDASTVYVAGTEIRDAFSSDAVVLALDTSTGAQQWLHRSSSVGKQQDALRAASISPDGWRIAIAIETGGFQLATHDIVTETIDVATRQTSAQRRYDGPGENWDIPAGITVTSDRTYVAGTIHGYGTDVSNQSPWEIATLAYSG